MSINVQTKRSFSSLLGLEAAPKKTNEPKPELAVDEVPELIQLTRDVILLLEKYKDQLDPIPGLIQELTNFGKTFTKIDVKINEYEALHYMLPAHLKEANVCLSLLKETLLQIQREVAQYADHQKDKLTNKFWLMFNQSQIVTNFQQFTQQVKGHCDHLLNNFLPILNAIVSSVASGENKDKVAQSIHSLSVSDKEKICAAIMKEQFIMKVYVPKGSRSKSPVPPSVSASASPSPAGPSKATATVNPDETIQLSKQTANLSLGGSDKNPEMITLKKQSSASRFLIEQKASKGSVHHEASDLREEEQQTPKEGGEGSKISIVRNLSFNLFEGKKAADASKPSPKPTEDPDYDVLPDYYDIKWLSVLPIIWRDFPLLTFGQIKFIYLSQNFFANYHNDMYFINKKTIEEVFKLQQYLENVKEIACFTPEDFTFVASTISSNKNLTMKQLIPLLHQRFQGTRQFTFLTLMASELFCTRVKATEKLLLDVVHQFPEEESKWPLGEVNLDWTVLHAIQKKHEKVKLVSSAK